MRQKLHQIVHGILHSTKEQKHISTLLVLRISCILAVAFLIAFLPITEAEAASSITLYDYGTKKEFKYTDLQVKVTLNKEKISVDRTPGILVNNIALVPYTDIFEQSPIDANCEYVSDGREITISKNGITIKMTLYSKTGYVNGKAVTLPEAPTRVKYVSENISKILVPSRFIAETLGYSYVWNKSTGTVSITKTSIGLSYDGGKKLEYTGAQGKVTIDGKSISLGTMPSIIVNNTAMLRAKKVFSDSSIGATYQYDSSKKTVTLTKGSNTLIMTIGSKTATLNGKTIKLENAPMIVKNWEDNNTYIMVPGSNTATNLGYDYKWNNTTRTSVITSRKGESNNGGSGSEPELGDDGVNESDSSLYDFKSTALNILKSSGIHELNKDQLVNTGYLYSIARDYSNTALNAETYMITNTVPYGKITTNYQDHILSIGFVSMISSPQEYLAPGTSSNIVNSISSIFNAEDLSTKVNLNIIPDQMNYDIRLSEDQTILYVTIYRNVISEVNIGTTNQGDYITFTGIDAVKATVTKQENYLMIDLPNTLNGVGEQYTSVTGTKKISYIQISGTTADRTQVILGLSSDSEYSVTETGNNYTITFASGSNSGSNQGSDPGSDPETPVEQGKYEIVIPKPTEVTSTMVSDIDYYNEKKIAITIPGDYTAYFKANTITEKSSVVSDISVRFKNNKTEILICTSKIQGYRYVTDEKNIYVHIDDPKDIYKNIVVLDPGHGGGAVGANYGGFYEKNINLAILYEVGKKYFNSNSSEMKVYYTRDADYDITLDNRAAFASKVGADLFVSLHMNASTSSGIRGTEVYYSTSNNKANSAGLTSEKLANLFTNNLTSALGTKKLGTKTAKFVVVHRNTVPAVLIELGFLSNAQDRALITDPDFQDDAVKVIYDTICSVFKQYPTGR
ncbi:MAG: hypothetical protein K0S47_1424 [Herbinix sp.]|jgi:N-acetylmuramoyl-L-alanine amidase|nr:hypothetical protein [Herbinix sp.]